MVQEMDSAAKRRGRACATDSELAVTLGPSRRSGEAPAYAGTDFIVGRGGRIAAVIFFFDKLP